MLLALKMQGFLDEDHAKHLAKQHVLATLKHEAINELVERTKQKYGSSPTWLDEAHTEPGLPEFEADLVSTTYFLGKRNFLVVPSMLRYKMDTQLVASCYTLLERVVETYILPALFD